jgi:hypothetical protein
MTADKPDEFPWDDHDESDDSEDFDLGEECGRWSNGRLTKWCTKAGSEECEFECPYRD